MMRILIAPWAAHLLFPIMMAELTLLRSEALFGKFADALTDDDQAAIIFL